MYIAIALAQICGVPALVMVLIVFGVVGIVWNLTRGRREGDRRREDNE